MMLRTQTALAMSGAVMLTALVLWLISNVQFDGTTLLQWSIALSGLLVASFVLAHILMRPLAAMSKSALALADHGNLPAPLSSDSEFGLFARALNGMAADVRYKSEALSEESGRRRNIKSALIDTSLSPVITVTPNGHITTWNSAAESLYGYTAAEAIGKEIWTHRPGRPAGRTSRCSRQSYPRRSHRGDGNCSAGQGRTKDRRGAKYPPDRPPLRQDRGGA